MEVASLIIAGLALVASLYATFSSRLSASRAGDAAERSAAVAERQLAIQLEDRAQAPPPWRIEWAGRSMFRLINEGATRTFAVSVMPFDKSGARVDLPGGVGNIDAGGSIEFLAIFPSGVDRRVIVNWFWKPDGPLDEWISTVPKPL